MLLLLSHSLGLNAFPILLFWPVLRLQLRNLAMNIFVYFPCVYKYQRAQWDGRTVGRLPGLVKEPATNKRMKWLTGWLTCRNLRPRSRIIIIHFLPFFLSFSVAASAAYLPHEILRRRRHRLSVIWRRMSCAFERVAHLLNLRLHAEEGQRQRDSDRERETETHRDS